MFHFPTTQTIAEDSPEQAVHENLEYLASMATISTPIPNTDVSWSTSATNFAVLYENMSKKINEICDRGFDELNTLIQEQRLVSLFQDEFSNDFQCQFFRFRVISMLT